MVENLELICRSVAGSQEGGAGSNNGGITKDPVNENAWQIVAIWEKGAKLSCQEKKSKDYRQWKITEPNCRELFQGIWSVEKH